MRRPERIVLAMACCLGLSACGGSTPPGARVDGPPVVSDALLETVELRGDLSGAIPGLGPRVDVHAFVRADGAVRARLRFDDPERGPVDEVLLWTADGALLYDRLRGGFADLGDGAPGLVFRGTRFGPGELVWLLSGRVSADLDADWRRGDGEWRGRRGDHGLRRAEAAGEVRTELVWREDGEIRTVALQGGPADWPRRARIEASFIDAPISLQWNELQRYAALGDSILDPFWEP